MTKQIVVLLVLQLLAPLAVVGWVALHRPRTTTARILTILWAAGYLVAIACAGLWLVLPWYLPAVFAVLLLAAVIRSVQRHTVSSVPDGGRRAATGVVFHALLTLLAIALAMHAFTGRRAPDGRIVDLAFPLRDGTYYVANAGSNQLLNSHLMTLTGDRFSDFRGQSHGVDVVKLDTWGNRAAGLLPSDPSAYAIFGEPVYAPCAGHVVQAQDGLRDLAPPQTDRKHMAGNHVLLACDDIWVLLGHLRNGSVRVQHGEAVRIGHELGQVGNTGNTHEPHLHIHAQRPADMTTPLAGEPLPIRLNGRYLYRNARIRQR